MDIIGCSVCHRVLYEADGPICVFCRPNGSDGPFGKEETELLSEDVFQPAPDVELPIVDEK